MIWHNFRSLNKEKTMNELKLKIRVGAIEMKAEGEEKFVQRERKVFMEFIKNINREFAMIIAELSEKPEKR